MGETGLAASVEPFTARATAMNCVVLPTLTEISQLYVPGANPAGSAPTWSTAGASPAWGETRSQPQAASLVTATL